MKKVSWEVRAGPQGSRVAHVVPGRTQTTLCRAVGRSHLEPLMGEIGGGRGATGAGAQGFRCVSMLEDDQSNLDACKLVQSLYGARRCIVQQIDATWKPAFNDIGGLVSPA